MSQLARRSSQLAGRDPDQVDAARTVWRTIGDQGIGSYAGFLGSDTEADLAALRPDATR
jgi:hypothetical protein